MWHKAPGVAAFAPVVVCSAYGATAVRSVNSCAWLACMHLEVFRTLQHQDAHESLNYLLNTIKELLQKEMKEDQARTSNAVHYTRDSHQAVRAPHRCVSFLSAKARIHDEPLLHVRRQASSRVFVGGAINNPLGVPQSLPTLSVPWSMRKHHEAPPSQILILPHRFTLRIANYEYYKTEHCTARGRCQICCVWLGCGIGNS